MPSTRSAPAIPIERFFVRGQRPEAVIAELKAQAKAAGKDPSGLTVAIGRKRLPLAKIEADLPAMWRDAFDPGPLGRGQAFRPQFEKDFYDPSISRLSKTSAERLGKLSDAAVKELTFPKPERLAKLELKRTEPGLILFLARSCELGTANATWAEASLRSLFTQPLDLGALKVSATREQELVRAWKRAAEAIGVDPSQVPVKDGRTGKLIALSVIGAHLEKRQHADEVFDSRRGSFVFDPSAEYDYDAGPMTFDYGTAPGYGGGTEGYFPTPRAPQQPTRPPVTTPGDPVEPGRPAQPATPRLAPAPPDVRVPPRPPANPGANTGVVFTPPPPPPPPALGRPLRSTPWEIAATPGATSFFEAKARGYDGSWEDWKAR